MTRSAWWMIAAPLALLAAACSDGDSTSGRAADQTTGSVAATAGAAATVTPLDQGVSVKKGTADFVPISEPTEVAPGDVVRTDETGFAEVDYADGSITRLDVDTEFEVISITDNAGVATTRAKLNGGRVWSRVHKLGQEGEFSIDSAVGVATVRGTAFVVDCRGDDECDYTVLEGKVDVDPTSQSTVGITAPSTVHVDMFASSAPSPVPFDEAFSDPWIAENARLDAEAGYDPADKMFEPYGPLLGSYDGQYDGTSAIVPPADCAAPADCSSTVGDVLTFDYVFSVECPSWPRCTRYVAMTYDQGGTPVRSSSIMVLDDKQWKWSLTLDDPSCTAGGTTTVTWAMVPTAAVRKDGVWLITAVQITAEAQPAFGTGCTAYDPPTTVCKHHDSESNDHESDSDRCRERNDG